MYFRTKLFAFLKIFVSVCKQALNDFSLKSIAIYTVEFLDNLVATPFRCSVRVTYFFIFSVAAVFFFTIVSCELTLQTSLRGNETGRNVSFKTASESWKLKQCVVKHRDENINLDVRMQKMRQSGTFFTFIQIITLCENKLWSNSFGLFSSH